MQPKITKEQTKKAHVFNLLKGYWKSTVVLAITTILANGLALIVPKFIAAGIDSYTLGKMIDKTFYIQFVLIASGIFLFTYFQGIFQTYFSEKVAYDLRNKLAEKVSRVSYKNIEEKTSAKLLTNFTSDVDSVKMFFDNSVGTVIASIFVIIGATGLLLSIDWKLALAVLTVLPFIGILFALVFKKLGPLFKLTQEIIDRFNTIISESIVGAAIVRVLNSGHIETAKFKLQNKVSKDNGMNILKIFSFMIPIIGVVSNIAILIILILGGKFVIEGSMSLGDFTAFNSYVYILIFPIIMLGFVSTIISRAQASYVRIQDIFNIEEEKDTGTLMNKLTGNIEAKNISMIRDEKNILKNISFSIKAGTKTAIIGPVAAGKTQLLQILFGLISPSSGEVLYDGKLLSEYNRESLYKQIAFVFQDSIMFNMSVFENIAFSKSVADESINLAMKTAELDDFIHKLPEGLDTVVSERGTSLSGGQKQRVMLARALALNPKILFLDDFTARVDSATEKSILENIEKNYPNITLISVTQKIQSTEHFEKIILLMEGEIVAEGTHQELVHSSVEYAQIMESQKSTQTYE
jgi:ATP-binding cassette subfamily B protein